LTLERTEGTEPAEQAAPAEGQAAEAPQEQQSDQAPANDQVVGTDGASHQSTETQPAADDPAGGATATTATADGPAAGQEEAPVDEAAPAEAAVPADESSPAEEAAQVEQAAPTDHSAPAEGPTEAAIGASGSRSLGDAAETADRAAEAVEAVGQPADAAAALAESPVASEPTRAATATAVREGPEPTTMEELLNEQPGEIRSLKHGDVVEGTVVRIDKDEILVDIGAKSEGVVSNRELYGRNAEVQPELNIGDTVLVYVLQPESPEGHAVLSLRRAGLERKWRSMQEQFDAGVIIEAPVIDHNKGGLIVDCGIRGFVPISQIVDFPRRPQNEQPRDAAQEIAEKLQPYVGRKLRLKILEVNRKANRLILSEKVALYEERREKRDELFSSLQVGQTVKGTVRSIAPFGVFVDLGGIDGLVHKSELSWNKVNNPEAGYKVGDEVEAEVIDINHERGRISLSIRRLQPDPWHSTVADLKVGDLIDGAVTKIVNFGAFVRVRDGLEGLIHISELSHQRVAHPGDVVHEGQRLKLKVISLDSERHRLGLSLKQAEEAPPRQERERRPRQERAYDPSQAVQEPEGGIDNTLAAAFAQVRQQMEETEAARRESGAEGDEPAAEATAEQPAEATAAEVTAAEATAEQPAEATAAETTAEQPAEVTAAETTAEQPAEEPAADEPAAEATAEATAEQPADEPAAEPAAEATAEQPADEPAAEATAEQPAAEPAAEKPRSRRKSAAVSTGAAEPVADTSAEPAEGAPDAAPETGADQEESAEQA
jgi:small subunit ribosomal protein S1